MLFPMAISIFTFTTGVLVMMVAPAITAKMVPYAFLSPYSQALSPHEPIYVHESFTMRVNTAVDEPSHSIDPRANVEWIEDTQTMDVCDEPTYNSQSNTLDYIQADDCVNIHIWLKDNPGVWEVTEWQASDNDAPLISMKTCAIALTFADSTKLPIS